MKGRVTGGGGGTSGVKTEEVAVLKLVAVLKD